MQRDACNHRVIRAELSLNLGSSAEAMVAVGDRRAVTAKRAGLVELWDCAEDGAEAEPAARRSSVLGAHARVAELFKLDTHFTAMAARPDVVVASSVDGTLALCPMLGDEGG